MNLNMKFKFDFLITTSIFKYTRQDVLVALTTVECLRTLSSATSLLNDIFGGMYYMCHVFIKLLRSYIFS